MKLPLLLLLSLYGLSARAYAGEFHVSVKGSDSAAAIKGPGVVRDGKPFLVLSGFIGELKVW